MFKEAICGFGVVFILCGMFFVCYIIFSKLLTRKGRGGFFAVVPGRKDDEDLPEKVYAAFIQANLLTFAMRNEVVVLDFGVSEKIKEQCRNIMQGRGEIAFCPADEIVTCVNAGTDRKL